MTNIVNLNQMKCFSDTSCFFRFTTPVRSLVRISFIPPPTRCPSMLPSLLGTRPVPMFAPDSLLFVFMRDNMLDTSTPHSSEPSSIYILIFLVSKHIWILLAHHCSRSHRWPRDLRTTRLTIRHEPRHHHRHHHQLHRHRHLPGSIWRR